MSRTVPEWIGKTPDTPVPKRVRLRVLEAFKHKCALCGRDIRAGIRWICDHIIALINGGENRESNLQPICDWCDKNIKTPADQALKSRIYKSKSRNAGLRRPKWRPLPGTRASGIRRRMDRTVERW